MSHEIELKLEIDPAAARRLLNEPWLCNGECEDQRQLSTYYDTAEGDVRRQGFTLRVRSAGDRFLQTVKTLNGGAGLFDRGEWEYEVGTPEVDPECLERTALARFDAARLEEVIRSEVTRWSCRIYKDGSEIQLDYDEGEIRAGGRAVAITELELELVRGEAAEVFALARRMSELAALKVGVLSKAERGFALADGRLGKVVKPEPVTLSAGMSVAEAFATITSSCIRHFRLNEPVVISRRSPDALHQARVALRRLRSAFSLFRSAIADRDFERLRAELRWFTRQLGDARNLDVYLQRDLPEDERPRVEREREAAYDRVIQAMESERCRSLMLDIVAWSTLGRWRGHAVAGRAVAPYVNRRIDRLWSKIGDARHLSKMSEDERHHLRIEAKKLRYALEFAAALHADDPHRQKKFAKAIEDLQESLGQLNDVAVARTMFPTDSWLIELHEREAAEQALIHDAGHSLDRLREIGRYWRDEDD